MLDFYKQLVCDRRSRYIREAEEERVAACLRPQNRLIFQWVMRLRKRKDLSALRQER